MSKNRRQCGRWGCQASSLGGKSGNGERRWQRESNSAASASASASTSAAASVSASIRDRNHVHKRRLSRPRPWESRPTRATSGRISPFILSLCYLSISKEAVAANNNLRQTQHQQHQQQQRRISNKQPSCIDQWHISIESASACTNSHIFPKEWADASVRSAIFHNTPDECCKEVIDISGKCDAINTCDDGTDNYYNGAQQQEANDGYFEKVTCMKTTWHMSTEVLYACTNDEIYPPQWNDDPELAEEFLFNSGQECCDESYPYQVCEVIDTCPTPLPTQMPTPRPSRTRRPRNRPTPKPTPGPTPTPEPTSSPTTSPPDWYVDRKNGQCVMDCVNEPGRPCGGRKSAWEDSFLDITECCDSIPWVPSGNCMATASPTKKKTEAPTNKGWELGDAAESWPTGSPTKHFDWYMERSTNRCFQDCEGEPGYPCGGKATQWETRYVSVEDCCASVPWKSFDQCASTASPVTASPTATFPPTPTAVAQQLEATPKPTKRKDKTDRPTGSPTLMPTFDCPAPTWFLFKRGVTSTCINDATYNDDIVNPSMKSYLTFDSADECCMSPFAGSNCHVTDVCNPVTRWFADYSEGWDDGHCISAELHAPPKGRRMFDSQLDCCLGGFLGQSSEICLSFLAS